jgi:hypothetical protein
MTYGRAGAPVIVVTRVAAPRGIVLVEDSSGGELPFCADGRVVCTTPTCIAVTCAESPTDITAGDLDLMRPGDAVGVFDGLLATPTLKVALRTVLGATLLEVPVPTAWTRIHIWANALACPNDLTVGIERGSR